MATLNLLTSSFNGKIGEHYGVSQYHKKFVKAVPFSHTPHNATQTYCVRAFEILNRVSSSIAEHYFSFLPLSAKNMTKTNAVSQFLKPLIMTHFFEVRNIDIVFGETRTFSIVNLNFDEELKVLNVNLNNIADTRFYSESSYFIGVFDYYGNQKGFSVVIGDNVNINVICDSDTQTNHTLLILRSVKKNNKWHPFGSYSQGATLPLIENSVLWCSRFMYRNHFKLNQSVLTADENVFEKIENETIILVEE